MKSIGKIVTMASLTTLLAIAAALAQASSGQTGGGDAKHCAVFFVRGALAVRAIGIRLIS